MAHKDLVFKMARGFYGRGKNSYRVAKQRVQQAMLHQYRMRRVRKRQARRLFITQINAATRQMATMSVAADAAAARGDGDGDGDGDATTATTATTTPRELSYSRFMHGCARANVALNRKMLAELAITEPYSFHAVATHVQSVLPVPPVSARERSRVEREAAFDREMRALAARREAERAARAASGDAPSGDAAALAVKSGWDANLEFFEQHEENEAQGFTLEEHVAAVYGKELKIPAQWSEQVKKEKAMRQRSIADMRKRRDDRARALSGQS